MFVSPEREVTCKVEHSLGNSYFRSDQDAFSFCLQGRGSNPSLLKKMSSVLILHNVLGVRKGRGYGAGQDEGGEERGRQKGKLLVI